MLTEIFTAIALFLVIEGIFPFLSPESFREAMKSVTSRSNSTLRYIGLSSMIAGLVILTIVR